MSIFHKVRNRHRWLLRKKEINKRKERVIKRRMFWDAGERLSNEEEKVVIQRNSFPVNLHCRKMHSNMGTLREQAWPWNLEHVKGVWSVTQSCSVFLTYLQCLLCLWSSASTFTYVSSSLPPWLFSGWIPTYFNPHLQMVYYFSHTYSPSWFLLPVLLTVRPSHNGPRAYVPAETLVKIPSAFCSDASFTYSRFLTFAEPWTENWNRNSSVSSFTL